MRWDCEFWDKWLLELDNRRRRIGGVDIFCFCGDLVDLHSGDGGLACRRPCLGQLALEARE
jgi:hypothetical protein